MSKHRSITSEVAANAEAIRSAIELLRVVHRGNLDSQLEIHLQTGGLDLVAASVARELAAKVPLWTLIAHCAKFAHEITASATSTEAVSVAALKGIFEALREKQIVNAPDRLQRELERLDVERRIDASCNGQPSFLWGAIVESAAFARESESHDEGAFITLAVDVTQTLHRIDEAHALAFVESLRALTLGRRRAA